MAEKVIHSLPYEQGLNDVAREMIVQQLQGIIMIKLFTHKNSYSIMSSWLNLTPDLLILAFGQNTQYLLLLAGRKYPTLKVYV